MEGTPRSWSDIPLELAGLVFCRLIAPGDRVHFAAVCPQWRSAAQQAPLPLPLLALKDGTFYSMPRGEPLHVPGCDGGFVTASGNWLVYNHLHCFLLVDPFSGATMTLPAPPSMDAPHSRNFVLVKLIVCSPHLIAALFEDDCEFQIAVCRPGTSSWSVAQEQHMWILDIAFYQEKLYAINYLNDLLALDISVDDNTGGPHVARIERVIRVGCYKGYTHYLTTFYLIGSRGSLLMVHRNIFHGHIHDERGQIHTFAKQCKPELAVFEADFRQSRWSKLMTLGDDQALFLGPCSRAVCVPRCDLQDKRVWFLGDYKNDMLKMMPLSGTDDMIIRKFSCPLPMISWRDHNGRAGAVWACGSSL
ncbi:unnamed protein product [Urochloa decumbens]|uniref:KIB1-4 beta-propeller domain-containing protein n=1 Tax=Urochloa decumbens TaxID=240449 RepID=A0ABC9ALP1_9POAL